MERPRLFLSTVSEELRTARQSIAKTVRTLGFDPVSQDDFPTGYGELRQWLREQVDSCEGLIQLVGDGYGAEPPEVDPNYGRISYTQFEFFYAYKLKKKTWIIVIGSDFKRDKCFDQLDLPRDSSHSDPTHYQAERRTLQQEYLARLKRDNYLRHTAQNSMELDNIVLRLRDELGELRREWEEWKYRIESKLDNLAQITTEKIRAHLLQTSQETHMRELAGVDQEKDWKRRQALRDAADSAQAQRLSRIEELAASFAEIEGGGTATSVFQELTRILAEQGVDEAIDYIETQRSSILKTVRTRAEAIRERNRADLQPLLQTAVLHQAKGQAAEARALYADILAIEPDWPEALHTYFSFLAEQGDLACIRTTLTDSRGDYEEAHRTAQCLVRMDSANPEWQHDLWASHDRIGDVLVAQGDLPAALKAYQDSLTIAEAQTALDFTNIQWKRDLSVSCNKITDMLMMQGKSPPVLAAYYKGFAIAEGLIARDLPNIRWQWDLIMRYVRLSQVTGDKAYVTKALDIARAMQQRGTLVTRDAGSWKS